MITLSEARALLVDHGIADKVGRKKDGTIIARKGYFYRCGDDESKFANRVVEHCEKHGHTVHLNDFGDHWAVFKGGSSIQKQSHFWAIIS